MRERFGRLNRADREAERELYRAIGALRRWGPEDVILDVGANVGQTINGLRRHVGTPRIFAFEPVESTFGELSKRTANAPNVKCFRQALGAEPGSLTIHHHDFRSSMSSFRPWWDAKSSEVVPINTVDAVLESEGIDRVHLLKIDTEGYELEVLRGAAGALGEGRIAIIQVEVGLDPRVWAWTCFEDVRQLLAPDGYFLHGFYEKNLVRTDPHPQWQAPDGEEFSPYVLNRCNALFVCSRYQRKGVSDLPQATDRGTQTARLAKVAEVRKKKKIPVAQ